MMSYHGPFGQPGCPSSVGKSYQVLLGIELDLRWISLILNQILEAIESLSFKQFSGWGCGFLIHSSHQVAAQEPLHCG